MKWLRSSEMEYISLIVNEDAAHDTIQKLGTLGVIEFTDLNPDFTPFQKRYASYVKRCDEMERKVRYFEVELDRFDISYKTPGKGSIETFTKGSSEIRYGSKDTALRALDTLERILEDKEQELLQLNSMHEKLTREYNERKELKEVISKAGQFFAMDLSEISSRTTSRVSHGSDTGIKGRASPLLRGPIDESIITEDMSLRFRHITGVVPAVERLKFERMLFRATRGNCYTRFSPIDELLVDPMTGASTEKHAFVIFFQSEFIENKLRKICDAFNARLYTLPSMEDRSAVSNLMQTNSIELNQSSHILRKNRESCVTLCRELADNIEGWKWTILQEKATYHTLNSFRADVSGMLRGEGWVIKEAFDNVRDEVTSAHTSADKSMPSLVDRAAKPWPNPPTHFYTNKFTDGYQSFVDTYGIPRYREINPAVFTAVTFPFLFGIMYGDIGHGTCLFLAGLYMVLTEKKLEQGGLGEMASQLYYGRYMIIMMGAFAMYAGFIYNDFFSLGLNLFGSRFQYPGCEHTDSNSPCQADFLNGNTSQVTASGQNVYPFGLDPIWKTSTNELLFFNSFKMKLSVILGIIQMFFGILLRGWNAVYFRNWLDFFFEFIPMLIFSGSLFLYMVFLIIYKWTINWNERMDFPVCPYNYEGPNTGCRPPALINTLINIALSPFSIQDPLYEGQLATQQALLIMAFLSIPVLLLAKPLTLLMMGKFNKPQHVEHQIDFDETQIISSNEHDHDDEPFGEVLIHQGIETIEFVLGMVSNTASYLRLWALSLAHSELAMVFWDNCMLGAINSGNAIFVFIGFAVFAVVTTFVLLLMDVLECFLHALRLHWVEFQNKFYRADGHKFIPFSFKRILAESQSSS